MDGTTTAQSLDSPCATGGAMNPHQAIQAPQPRQEDLDEILADFDTRCHDRYQLEASQFHLKLPVRLLSEAERLRYEAHIANSLLPRKSIMQAPVVEDEFKGAAGMHSFSIVFFNHAHTVAMTEIGMYCGNLCGSWRWVVLEKRDGEWQTLLWVTMMSFSCVYCTDRLPSAELAYNAV